MRQIVSILRDYILHWYGRVLAHPYEDSSFQSRMKVRTVSKTEVLNSSTNSNYTLYYIFRSYHIWVPINVRTGMGSICTFITTNTLSSTSVEELAEDWFLMHYKITLVRLLFIFEMSDYNFRLMSVASSMSISCMRFVKCELQSKSMCVKVCISLE